MLHEFLLIHRAELTARCQAKVIKRASPASGTNEVAWGIPVLIDQLIRMLRADEPELRPGPTSEVEALDVDIDRVAAQHGGELRRKGFTVDQVVHNYGDLCQAVTELAHETNAPISVDEFHTFNRCLDSAIAGAVTEFGRQRDHVRSEESARTVNERLGFLAHEIRNLLNTATLAYSAIKSGHGALTGATGAVVDRSLAGIQRLIDRALADVRLTEGLHAQRESTSLDVILEEVRIAAQLEAATRNVVFTVSIEPALSITADREMLSSAVANLLQNAFKFTRPGGHVSLTARVAADQVLIEVADECGGLKPGWVETFFVPFSQSHADRSGLGLGLSISRRAVETNGGKLQVRDMPGTGCVFIIELPTTAT